MRENKQKALLKSARRVPSPRDHLQQLCQKRLFGMAWICPSPEVPSALGHVSLLPRGVCQECCSSQADNGSQLPETPCAPRSFMVRVRRDEAASPRVWGLCPGFPKVQFPCPAAPAASPHPGAFPWSGDIHTPGMCRAGVRAPRSRGSESKGSCVERFHQQSQVPRTPLFIPSKKLLGNALVQTRLWNPEHTVHSRSVG